MSIALCTIASACLNCAFMYKLPLLALVSGVVFYVAISLLE